ncbi:hypothetical protein JCM5296_004509 [Sporobolomyces johnsonii]
MAAPPLVELVLSSTFAASPLPTISLHNPQTGALVFSFKAPLAPSTTTSTSSAASATPRDQDGADQARTKTMALVEGANGVGGVLLGLGGKDGRAALNVWNFTKEATQQRLIPPVRLSTIAASPDGVYLAGGTNDGRVFLWELSTGHLLITLDAHYRAISALAFTQDSAALVTASDDAGVSVWSIGLLLNASPLTPPAPFATLSDHTLGITSLCVGLGSFPHCRVLTGSLDGTVKVWDLSTTPPALLSTFEFPHPVHHLAWDPLERFFFAAGPSPSRAPAPVPSSSSPAVAPAGSGGRVTRVNLYRRGKDEFGIHGVETVGGGGRAGEVERIGGGGEGGAAAIGEQPGEVYELNEPISSLSLSPHSPLLLVGTHSTSSIHVLALPSLLPVRVLAPPPSSTPPGPITFLATLLRPAELGAGSGSGSEGAGAGVGAGVQREIMKHGGMGRTVLSPNERERGGRGGRTVEVRIGRAVDVEDLVRPAMGLRTLPTTTTTFLGSSSGVGVGGAVAPIGVNGAPGGGGGGGADARVRELEREVEALKRSLGKAVGINERMWKGVVEGALAGGGGGGGEEAR